MENPPLIGSKAGVKKHQTPQEIANHFKPGNKANPSGRPKGSRSAFAETFLKDFLHDWEENGASAITACRNKDPSTYLKVAASLLPKQLDITDGQATLDRMLDKMNDKQLDQLIHGLIAIGADSSVTACFITESAQPNGTQPDSVY